MIIMSFPRKRESNPVEANRLNYSEKGVVFRDSLKVVFPERKCTMKRISLLVFVLMPALAFGQAGNQLGPLHLPFEFKITVNGLFAPCIDESPYSPPTSFVFDWIIDSGDTNYHLNNDTITYNDSGSSNVKEASYFKMIFDTTTETVRELSFAESQDYIVGFGGSDFSQSLELINLKYNSTSIFSPNSGLTNHLGEAYYYSYWEAATGNPPPECDTLVYVTSVNLSGNFQPVVLWAGVAMPAASPSTISIIDYDGTIQCTFPSSDQLRILELYTPLAMKAAAIEITSGQGSISLPNLSRGLYFLRLDGNVIKFAVP